MLLKCSSSNLGVSAKQYRICSAEFNTGQIKGSADFNTGIDNGQAYIQWGTDKGLA